MKQTIAERLGTFVADTTFEQLPREVVEKAKRHILDTLGAALVGATSEEAGRARAALLPIEGSGIAPVWGRCESVAPRNAALLNGIAAHAFELDDTGGCDHSGAVVLPAAVAALSLLDKPVSGRAFIIAVVLGYDVGRRALEGFGGYRPHNEAGWHSTGTCGTFAAAAACASLLRLTPKQARSCLGLAASFSGGLWAFIHDGAMAKRVHAGRAAESGLLAALLARANMTGPAHVFEDVWGGFLRTYAHASTDPDALLRDLGESWRIMRCAIKPYASCRDTHAAVDAIGRILAHRAVEPDNLAGVGTAQPIPCGDGRRTRRSLAAGCADEPSLRDRRARRVWYRRSVGLHGRAEVRPSPCCADQAYLYRSRRKRYGKRSCIGHARDAGRRADRGAN